MKITIHIPEKWVPGLDALVSETGAKSIGDLFYRSVMIYVYLFRITRQGLQLAFLNSRMELASQLIDREKLVNLFDENEADSLPPAAN